jgi:hypothetical protein
MEIDLKDIKNVFERYYSEEFDAEYKVPGFSEGNNLGEIYINGNSKEDFSYSLENNCGALVFKDFQGKASKKSLKKIIDLNEDIAKGLGFTIARVITSRDKIANEFYKKGYEFYSDVGEKIL